MKVSQSSLRSGLATGVWILAVVVLLGACQQDPGEDTVAVSPGAGGAVEQPEQKFYDYKLFESEAGVRQWILDSDEMLKYAGRSDVELVRVKIDFFREGVYYSTLVSDSGTADLTSNDVFVWGHVVITNTEGRRLRTSELRFTNEDGRIRNEVYNVFDQGEDLITGIGLEATPDLTYLVITREVAAEIGDVDDGARDTEADGERP